MEAAYAALLSLFHTLNNINIHPSPPISLDQKQLHSLTQNITFLLHLFESYPTYEDDDLENRIAAAAYAAEDVIETRIVDRIHARSNTPQGLGRVLDLMKKKARNIMGVHHSDLYGGLKIVIKEIDLIKTEVMHILQHPPHLHTNSYPLPPISRLQSSTMPVFDDAIIIQLLDKLVGQRSSLQIVPIVGMGGIGFFPEDEEIRASLLMELWVAEGIVRPIDDKSLEDVAKEYLKELVDRNLILVAKLRWDGATKVCKIHDLLRDVSLREAQKKKFICIVRQQKHHSPQDINMERRICISDENANEGFNPEFLHAMESALLTRSLLYRMRAYWHQDSPSVRLGLLRVYSSVDEYNNIVTYSNNVIFKHANLRYLSLKLELEAVSSLRSLCCLLWNLQTLKVGHLDPLLYSPMMEPSEIWDMPLLKHVKLDNFVLPDPPNGEHNFVLKYLETLSGITNFSFSEEVIKRIPNVKKLKVKYTRSGDNDKGLSTIKNIGCLQKLEYVNLDAAQLSRRGRENMRRNLVSFPYSLKKLSLKGTGLSWEELTMRIGSLPLLQFLKLGENACRGAKWETVEGQFCSLKVLHFMGLGLEYCEMDSAHFPTPLEDRQLSFIDSDMEIPSSIGDTPTLKEIWWCHNLKYWETDSTHFPRLEHLYLSFINFEIPSSIGDIPTLKSIRLECCSESAHHSAKRIKVEQEENGNEDLQIETDYVGVQVDSDEHDSDKED